ncbi:hypothetical protein QFC19_003727 [Naganishia cerealis]|uniref:Uncharacterized protein n=1 Tax=Naganishia cerealis TaxID=610337 RepID=A0ACC2VZZ8_9TREE|nr:hypothetical protein QFC19_003727 [Naganishia cerealis]
MSATEDCFTRPPKYLPSKSSPGGETVSVMATPPTSAYPERIEEEDVMSISSGSIATSRHPESTRTFGSPSKNERLQYFGAPSMSRHFSHSSQHSGSMSPFGHRYDTGKASLNNVIVLEPEIDPLDTRPLQVVVPLTLSPVANNSPHDSSVTHSPEADINEDLFPDASRASSQTSVQEDAALRTVKQEHSMALASSQATAIPPSANSVFLAPPLADPLPVLQARGSLVPSINSSPEMGSTSRRISRKQVPMWTSSLEDLEQSKKFANSSSLYPEGAGSMQDAGRSHSLPLSTFSLHEDVQSLALDARRFRMGGKGSSEGIALPNDEEQVRAGKRLVEDADSRLKDVPNIRAKDHRARKFLPDIPARSASLLRTDAILKTPILSGAKHHFDHFTYEQPQTFDTPLAVQQAHQAISGRPAVSDQVQDGRQTAAEERRPSDQTFTSGFSLTCLTDEEPPSAATPSSIAERSTSLGKQQDPLPEPLRGYEPGVRFSVQPGAGRGTFGKSKSENFLPIHRARLGGSGAQWRTTGSRGTGTGGEESARRSMELFTLPEVGSMSVPSFHRGISDGSGRDIRKRSPRGSPMLEQAPTFATETTVHPIPAAQKHKMRLFSRRRTKHRIATTDGTGNSSSEYVSDASTSAGASGLAATLGGARRREKKIRRKREAAIFEAGPDRLPTPRELLVVSKLQVYNVEGEKVMFGDIVAGGGGQQTIVVFIRHWYCPLCAEYVECIVRTVDPEALEKANVKLVIIGNGSRRMLPAYSKKVMRSPFEMFTDPKLRVYRGLGMTRQTHDGGEEEDKGDYITMGPMRGTLEVAKRATKMPLGRPGTIPQLGGEFIFSSALQCSYAHRMTNTRAHAPIRDVVARTGALLDFIHVERGPPPPAIHRTPALPTYEMSDGMVFGNWGESGVEMTQAERYMLEQRRTSEGEGWKVERERELERIRRERERRRSRLHEVGKMACEAEEGEGMTTGDEGP